MKKLIMFFCLIASIGTCYAQNEASDFTDNNSDRPRDPRADQMNFVPNEVLVKFKDDVTITGGTNLKSAGINSVDQILKANGVTSLEKLFPAEKKLKSAQIVKDPTGRDMIIPSLHNIYRITVPQLKSTGSAPADIFKFIEELKALPEVEYAEPNYIYSVDDLKPTGPILTADDVAKLKNENHKSAQTAVIPNDPLYSQQWYIPAVKADLVWAQTTGDTTQVIAILDTGVDWNHPDLKNKIWRNKQEIAGNGRDDDGNGLIDDIRGWDFINNDNNPMDDNSHGTHVAGIAAAEANNGIGIAGVNWKAKIMPIKVFPSSGSTNIAKICQGINYATNNGATVINMSFGGYSRSLALEDALKYAFSKNIMLVAAAGNDSQSIYQGKAPYPTTFYPAALPYVLGVQADAAYSNFDPDGPVYSDFPEGFNYELKAPGTALSTVPNGNYRLMSGTSMATPVISGSVALYRSLYPEKSSEELWSDFIYSSDGIIDLNKAFFGATKSARLDLLSFSLTDLNEGDDKDGQADAGEIVDIVVNVRNTGSPANDVYVKIKQSNDGDPKDITILTDSVNIGSIGIYGTRKNDLEPFKVKINTKCFNNRIVSLDVMMRNKMEDPVFTQKLTFRIFNGEELSGILLRDTTLTPDKNWVITNSLRIAQGVTLTILPGTDLQINAGVDNRGFIKAIGNENNHIKIEGTITGNNTLEYVDMDLRNGGWSGNAKYCNFINGTTMYGNYEYCTFTDFTSIDMMNFNQLSAQLNNCYIKNCIAFGVKGSSSKCIFDNVYISNWAGDNSFNSKYSVFNKIGDAYQYCFGRPYWNDPYAASLFLISSNGGAIYENSFLSADDGCYFVNTSGGSDAISLPNQYWGTIDPLKIKKKYSDFWNSASKPFFIYNPLLIEPSDSCHAHVWKVLVNGKDAQDEKVEPVGTGKQRFDIFFNRPMDKSITPAVSFGVKFPYNQQMVNEEGFWSVDGKIYTVFKNIKLTTGDGINRMRVDGAKEANGWDFEIPLEDQRFEFVISAANSASMDFQATPSLGKVKLEWNNNTLADRLGFNMYRMEHVNDSVLTNPVLINSTLITDTLYTDFAVTPNKKYYYYYKILRTNLVETDSSKVVSATPFTASKGDANGDLNVNVLDITTIVAYLLNNNPQPFIFEAADYNSDGNINVLDIVGVVNLVLGGPKSAVIATTEQVQLYMQNDTLFADAPVAIGGIQFDISGATSVEEIQKLKALEGFESGYNSTDKGLRLLYYSLSGKTIPAGTRIPLLKLKKGSGITDPIFANKTGTSIPVNYLATGVWNLSDNLNESVAELGQNYPNPLDRQTTIPIRINEPVDEAVIRIVNVMGQEVDVIRLTNPTVGEHLLNWNSGVNKGFFAYLLEIRRGKQQFICPVRKMMVQ